MTEDEKPAPDVRRVIVRRVVTGALVAGLLGAGAVQRAVPESGPVPREDSRAQWLAGDFQGIEPPEALRMTRAERLLVTATGLLHETRSVRMATDVRKGQQRVRMDVRIDRAGSCAGSFDGGVGNRGTLVVVAGKGPEAYMRFSEAALAELQRMADSRGATVSARMRDRIGQMRGKYVKAPSKGAEGLAKGCSITRLIGSGEDDWKGTRQLAPVRREGRRVIPLAPSAADDDQGVAYVDAEGKPYLRALKGDDKEMSVDLRFSEYGKPVTVRRPAAAEVVEFADDGAMFSA
ncbi:hypothetical protein ACIRO1_18285 [Streptomyces sp. NPDC102381]|uniref:hypothetical protein n=1 Tax=Streptomyces sp. NPDC102381 TaxID=3366164 RepID=UPI00380A2350